MSISRRDLGAFVDALERRDRDQAEQVTRRVLASGIPMTEVIIALLAPAQAEVGRRWEGGRWSVAQEHAATAIVEDVLLALSVPPTTDPDHRVAVLCPEREYHGLAARMVSCYLEASGWHSTFLGASVPTASIGDLLLASRPVAVLVSCSISVHLRAALDAVAAAHSVGVPVLAGGSAFGYDDVRAIAIGADEWVTSPSDAINILNGWRYRTPTLARARASTYGEHAELAARRRPLAEAAVAAERADSPVPLDAADVAALRAGYTQLIDNLAAADLVADPRIVEEHLDWLRRTVPAGATGDGVVRARLDRLAGCLPVAEFPNIRALLAAAAPGAAVAAPARVA